MSDVHVLLNDPDTAGVWNLDSGRSTVGFSIKNFWGLIKVKGRFTDVSADGQITGRGAIFGRLDIQVASLSTGIGKRDEHLRSADFFDAEHYPTCKPQSASKGSRHPSRCRLRSAHSTTARCG
jgi:polyisoprenoid-binding protein YceI